jgi:DNA-directed RNA polymerase subunit beta'
MKKRIKNPKTFFRNKVVTKKYLKEILFWAFRNFGMARAGFLADSLKKLGFYFATQGAISISIEDLKIPPLKNEIVEKTKLEINKTQLKCITGQLTEVEKYQQLTNYWNSSSEILKNKVVNYLKNFDPLNPVYMMAFSGARGNLSQVRQLIGMRGLMAGPSGDIIDIPITTNFREGLSVTDYMISAYGARKGLVDTALKTADSGYLTRRLVDVAQDILIRETDCKTKRGIFLFEIKDGKENSVSLKDSLVGRILAKDIEVIIDSQKNLALRNQQITPLLAKKLQEANFLRVLVRSPLTCNLNRSICQSCYGWNLAYGKLVDLGEAVGIVAAQSIGEPGTQLTMRTFHTGGVFTSEANGQIYSKNSGQIIFPNNLKSYPSRTLQGDNVLILENDSEIQVVDFKNKKRKLSLEKETILFAKKDQFIQKNQIIAILPQTKQASEKKQKKEVLSTISGEILLNNNFFKKTFKRSSFDNSFNFNRNTLLNCDGSVFWVLKGKVFTIPQCAQINKYTFSKLKISSNLATIKLITYESGLIKTNLTNNLLKNQQDKLKIKINIENFLLLNSQVYLIEKNNFKNFVIKIENNKFFYLKNNFYQIKKTSSIVGQEINTKYQTNVSGIIFYTNLKSESKPIHSILGGGLLFLPEERFFINKDTSIIKVRHGDWVESNTEIAPNIFNKNSGFVEINEKNNIVKCIIIKNGSYLNVKNESSISNYDKKLLFPGEYIFETNKIDQLTYTEIVESYSGSLLLMRPIFFYELPKNRKKFENKHFYQFNYNIFKHRQRVIVIKNKPISLLKTNLLFLNNNKNGYENRFSFLSNKNLSFSLQYNLFKTIFSKKYLPYETLISNLNVSTFFKDNQYIEPYSIIGNISIVPKQLLEIKKLKEHKKQELRKIFLVSSNDYQTIFTEQKNYITTNKSFLKVGDILDNKITSSFSGKIIYNNYNYLKIHKGKPFLFSKGAEIFWRNNEFVKEYESLGVLFYQRAQTGDIVQGLPKVEEILEARRKKLSIKSPKNPGIILEIRNGWDLINELTTVFVYINRLGIKFYQYDDEIFSDENYFINSGEPINTRNGSPHTTINYLNHSYKKFLDSHQASYRTLRKIQSYLLNSIQTVYSSQGVDISDKHLEIIVKQMASKVRIKNRAETEIIPGEYIDLYYLEKINLILKKTNSLEITYQPVLLGITKASLVTESFISAASFQETVRILTNAAIQGKADWLRGIKENVIIGRLISAGTGFNSYDQISNLTMRIPKNKKF